MLKMYDGPPGAIAVDARLYGETPNTYRFVQTQFNGGTGTVNILGRISDEIDWRGIVAFTGDSIRIIGMPTFIRFSGLVTGGSRVQLYVDGDGEVL